MGYAVVGGLILFVIIFSIVWYVAELCSVLGIVFGCISCSNSKKYVNTRGLGSFKSVKNYRTAATVFMVISCIVIALWLAFFIWFEITAKQYSEFEEDALEVVTEFLSSSITMLAVHIGSVIAGSIAQVQYKKAKELNADILNGRVVPPPPPVVMMPVYPANPYQQNGYYQNSYNGQQNGGYPQNGSYYNQPNPYGQNPQQIPYNPNPQGYQPPPQNNPYNGQGYQNPPANCAFANGQTNTQAQFPDPTVTAASAAVNAPTSEGEKNVTCPN
ncbi:MAG: hypothetical protein K2K41_08825, partial [Ruminiclostridium sp.]|nr:hypothetical protein [Ruminiclostridium sp.]